MRKPPAADSSASLTRIAIDANSLLAHLVASHPKDYAGGFVGVLKKSIRCVLDLDLDFCLDQTCSSGKWMDIECGFHLSGRFRKDPGKRCKNLERQFLEMV